MATLTEVFGRLPAGGHDLQIRLLGWQTVGSCVVAKNGEYEFSASGKYSALGRNGSFDIDLTLTDRDPAANSGPCRVTNAGQTLQGTYSRSGTSISFSGGGHTISASADPGGVILQVEGYPKIRIAS